MAERFDDDLLLAYQAVDDQADLAVGGVHGDHQATLIGARAALCHTEDVPERHQRQHAVAQQYRFALVDTLNLLWLDAQRLGHRVDRQGEDPAGYPHQQCLDDRQGERQADGERRARALARFA